MGALKATLTRWSHVLRWMAAEVIWGRRATVILALGSDLLSVVAQVGAITIALTYARMLQKGTIHVGFFGLSVNPRESMWLLAAASLGVLVTWQVSSLTRYYADRTVLRLGIYFEHSCFKQILSALTHRVRFQDELRQKPLGASEIPRMTTAYVRQSGVASRILLEAIIPFCVFCISFFTLLRTSLLLTMMVVALCILFLPLIWKVNRQGVASTRDFFTHQPQAGKEKRLAVNQLTSTYTPCALSPEYFDPLINEGRIADADEAFGRRILVVQRSQMATQCLMGAGIALVVAVFGFQALTQAQAWGSLVIYIIALRYCLANLSRVASSVASFNRLYPSVSSVYHFLRSRKQHQDVEPVVPGTLTIKSDRRRALPGTVIPSLSVDETQVDLISMASLDAVLLPHLLESLFELNLAELRGLLSRTWLATADFSPGRMPLKDFLQLSTEGGHDEILSEELAEFWAEESFDLKQILLDCPLTDRQWRDIPRRIRHAIALSAAIHSDMALVVLSAELLNDLEEPVRRAWLERCLQQEKKALLVFHRGSVSAYNADLSKAPQVVLLAGVDVLAVQDPAVAKRHEREWDKLMSAETSVGDFSDLDTSVEDEMDDMDVTML